MKKKTKKIYTQISSTKVPSNRYCTPREKKTKKNKRLSKYLAKSASILKRKNIELHA